MLDTTKIADDWRELFDGEFQKPYFETLNKFVEHEYETVEVFPLKDDIFKAFELCSVKNLKVVILGQDPYHNDNQANGLAFSVPDGVKIPGSLNNILNEVSACGYMKNCKNGDLSRWAKQGVLLLNSVLTVRAHMAGSHARHGWENFTDQVIRHINEHKKGVVYILWGGYAARKVELIDSTKNLILTGVHPSPLSAYRGFKGCGHFMKANQYLKEKIVW